MLAELAAWLADTSLSRSVGAALWVVPFAQSLHILAIALVMGPAWIIAFRILGVAGHGQSVTQTYTRLVRWIWGALPVLLLSGIVLIIGEPARELTNPAFLAKLCLLATVILLTAWLQFSMRRSALAWDGPQGPPLAVRAIAIVQLLQWLAIAVAGRWIAYTDHL